LRVTNTTGFMRELLVLEVFGHDGGVCPRPAPGRRGRDDGVSVFVL